MNKKIVVGVAIVFVVVIAVAVVFLLPKAQVFEDTISGSWPEVYYIPVKAGDGKQYNLTIELVELGEGTWAINIGAIDEFWDLGTDNLCTIYDLGNLEAQGKLTFPYQLSFGHAQFENRTKCSHIIDKDMTFFVPLGGSENECKFHVKLEKIE